MERIVNKSISIILTITLSFMCIPANAVSAFAATNETGQSTSVVEESGTEESSSLSTNTQDSADDTQTNASSIADTVLSALSSANNSSDTSLSTTDASTTPTNREIFGYYKAYGDTYEYHYRDSYFTKSSTSYDASLSTMSFNLAMAAFGSSTGTTDEDYANADSNIKDLMAQLGFTDYECTEDFHKVPTATTIGAAISHKEIVDENGETRTLIAVAIRGGNYQQEWSGNATIGTDGEAEGFGIARDKVVDLINNYLAAHQDEISDCPKFWITGFSRGSAVANLTANYLNYCMENYQNDADVISTKLAETTRELLKNKKATQDDLFCYGFEVPAGGSKTSKYLCDNYNNIWNIVDPTDLVPLVAPSQWGFYRYGNDVDDTAGISEDELKTQLGAISQSALNSYNNLHLQKDGEFRLYTSTVLGTCLAFKNNNIESLGYSSKSKDYKATYLKDFINYTAQCIGNRENYSKNYEEAVSIVAGLMFSGADVDKIMDVAMSGIGKTFSKWKWTKIGLYILGNPATLSSSTGLKAFLNYMIVPDCLKNAIKELRNNSETRAMIGDAQLDTLEKSIPTLSSLAIALVLEDSSFGLAGLISLVPTAYYYKGELISAHNVNTVLAYLRAGDTSYNSVSPDGSYCLTYASSNNGGFMSGQVTVKNANGDQIANFEGGNLTETDGTVKASKNTDGSVTLFVAKTDANKKVTFEVNGPSTTTDVYLKYYDYKEPGSVPIESKQSWENQAISVNSTSAVTLTCEKGKDDAVIGKKLHVNIYDVVYDETAEGHYKAINDGDLDSTVKATFKKDGSTCEESTNSNAEKTITVNITQSSDKEYPYDTDVSFTLKKNSGTYTPLWGFSPVMDENGYPVIDDTGAYEYEKTYDSATVGEGEPSIYWEYSANSENLFNLDSLSTSFYVVCAPDEDAEKTHRVSAYSQLNDSGSSNLEDVVPTITAGSSTNTNFIKAGDEVTVSMHSVGKQQYDLDHWNLQGIDKSSIAFSNANKELTFTMPDNDVDLTAIFILNETDPTLTVQGSWDDSNDGQYGYYPSEDWKSVEVYTKDDEQYAFKEKTYYAHASSTSESTEASSQTGESTSKSTTNESVTTLSDSTTATVSDASPHCYFLLASEYKYDSINNRYLQFDHWEVTQKDGVDYLGVDFGRKVLSVENGTPVYGDLYNLNGCTDRHICIDGSPLTQSVAVKPVYTSAKYTYNVTLSDGSVVTGTAAEGETVTVENSIIPEGLELDEWEITENIIKDYYSNYRGFITVNTGSITTKTIASSYDNLSFKMPRGNVEAKAVNKVGEYDLTLTDPQVIEGTNTIKNVVVSTKDGTEVSDKTVSSDGSYSEKLKAGLNVKINFYPTDGFHYTGCSGLEDIALNKTYASDGSLESIEFTMPGKNLGKDSPVTFSYAANNYILKYSNATAKGSDGETINSGSSIRYDTKVIFEAASASTGMKFSEWKVESAEAAGQGSYQDTSGNQILILTMPNSDVEVTPVYEKAEINTPIEKANLTLFNGILTEGTTLPTKVTATTSGLDTTAYEVEWFDEDGNEASIVEANNTYIAKIKLIAANGYEFDDGFSATIDGVDATVNNLGERVAWVQRAYVASSEEDKSDNRYVVLCRNIDFSDVEISTYESGETVEIEANEPELGETFTGFTLKPKRSIVIPEDASTLNFSFTMPNNNIDLTANYTVDKVDIELATPVAGQPLSSTFSLVNGTTSQLNGSNVALSYMDEEGNEVNPSTIAEYGAQYTVLVSADLVKSVRVDQGVFEAVSIEGYTFSDGCEASVNGNKAQIYPFSETSCLVAYTFEPTAEETHTVTFDVQGIGAAPEAQIIAKDDVVTKPSDPTAEGYVFGGWFKDSGCTDQWVFETDTVTSDTTLYAKWTKSESVTPVSDNDSEISSAVTTAASEEPSVLAQTGDFTQWAFAGFLVVAIAAGGVLLFLRRKQYK